MGGAGRAARLVCGRRAKWIILVLWVVVLAAAGPAASKLTDAEKNDASAWLPGNAESTKVVDQSKDFLPQNVTAVVVFARSSGLTPADNRIIASDAAQMRTLTAHGIVGAQVQGPILDRAEAPRAALVLVPITFGDNGWNSIGKAVDEIRAVLDDNPDNGLETHITGPGGVAADSSDAFQGIDGTLLFAALAVVVVILLFTYRSPTLLLVPVVCVVGALFVAQALIYVLARHASLVVNAQSAGILTVLVFGAGTDYALLLVARYREELRRHEDRHEAMALALHRAGPAVIASASTVILGMLCLLAAEMNSTNGLGPVAAIGVAVALLVMLTLFPAVLLILGRWIFWPVIPHLGSPEPTETGLWARTGRRIARRPRAVWIGTVAALGALSFGLLALNAEGLTTAESFTGKPDSVVGQTVQARYFPAGTGQPLQVVANTSSLDAVRASLATVSGVVPESIVVPPDVPAERDGRSYVEATLTDAADSGAAQDTVDDARAAVHAVPQADALVGGGTAAQLDSNRASVRDEKLLIPVILAVVLIILALLLRAVVAPVVLIATVVLSFTAALGVSALVFRHIFDFPAEDTSFPLLVFVFLVALGIDYNIFLTTRVREESIRSDTRTGALTGLAATGGVITSAGLVLAGTFAALATLPIVGFAEIGFAVALGVLVDTLVVRSVVVTALILDLRERMWWPSALWRRDARHTHPTPPAGPDSSESRTGP
ncbi:MMPL family transporter (plasmid) [Embleya sp. NBC_00888]|uniref:MMPL family transporter n=1 Tax=Embleya sp. NBC_00888 TaxID=2975960 RepID=UPI002F9163DF|nr:MMPL family transporter [Embleya sp. NBC_00888]